MEVQKISFQQNMKKLMQEPSCRLTNNPLLKNVNFFSKEAPVTSSPIYSILSNSKSSVNHPQLNGKPLVSLVTKN